MNKIKTLILTALATATMTVSAAAPRYVFYFIGDGMGLGPVMAADAYNRMARKEAKPLTMLSMPVASWCKTYSASTPVTDSSAAGTALATGTKTKNGMLGMNPDTIPVVSIASKLQADGFGIGIITSVPPDDATPGAFYAHVPNRSMYYEIGKQAASCGFDFIAGSRLRGTTDKSGNPTDLLNYFAENDVQIVRGPEGLKDIKSKRVLALNSEIFTENRFPYALDSIRESLTLPMVTEACLNHLLKNSPDRFFMMVEGGHIDYALHANDGVAAVKEVINFDQALEIAYQFYLAHPDETLIVVTADHDTGGMTLGNGYLHYEAFPEYFDYQKVSKEQFSNYCKSMLKSRRVYTWDDMREYLADNLGFWTKIGINDKETAHLKKEFEKSFANRNSADQETLYASFNSFAKEVFRIYDDHVGIGFTTTSHTGNPVPVFAIGDGADLFKGVNNNIEIPEKIYKIIKE